jgi:hypothetical protein
MKIKHKAATVAAGMSVLLFVSCSTIGNYLPVSPDEIVIGTIQTTFVARDSWLSKKETMNSQAYIKLLEAAVQKYSGNIDIRDIVWVTGRTISPRDTEVSATAKVIKADPDETRN